MKKLQVIIPAILLVFILINGCIDQEEITKEKAIGIANQTEEVKEFLKLYPSANFSVSQDVSSWSIVYYYIDGEVRISVDKSTGKILTKYPKLEYIKSITYCEKDDDCVPASSRCACVNFIHKYPPEGIVEEVCGPAVAVSDCKCVNNQCNSK